MADETFPLRYKFKRKTTAQWASLNPVLLPGEPGIEVLSDGSEKIKYGDGVKTWSALSYAAGGGAGGPALSSAAPQALGASAAPGTSVDASRADHVHPRPTAGQVGADPAGTAAAAVAVHEAAADPHPGYLTAAEGNAAYATAAQGALAASAIQPGNAALTDSREWSADTISQAEAEAGTATTRRAFTALRVFQAIASWWNGSAAKTKLDGIQDGAQVNAATNLSYDATTRNLASSTGSPAVLPLFGSAAAGLVPASEGGTSNFLRADGTFAAPPGGTPGGSSGQVQFNNGGAFGGLSTLTADGSGNLTLSARLINAFNAAASAPAKLFSGTWFTGGTSTTTKPHLLIEPAGTVSANWNTAGTGFGINAPPGFTGDLAWFGVNGARQVRISAGGEMFSNFWSVGSAAGLMKLGDANGNLYAYFGTTTTQLNAQTLFFETTSASLVSFVVGGTSRALNFTVGNAVRAQISTGGVFRYSQPAPAAVNTTATLTVANLQAGIITTTTAAAVDMTLPTGTNVEGGFAVNSNDLTMEWSVINTGSNGATVLAATDHTLVGSGAVAAGSSGRFATRRTAANTYVTYRLS